MTMAVAFMMPFVMLGILFLLARIEDRHLTVRTRVLAPVAPAPHESAPQQDAA